MIHRPQPSLWTPNRKAHAPMPLCRRCLGFDRRYYQRNRTRMGFVYHRACCCGGGCPDSITVTFVGVNAGICQGCFTNRNLDIDSLSVDGTYSPLMKAEDDGLTCTYYTNASNPFMTINLYSGPGCQGLLFQLIATSVINITINKSTGNIKTVIVSDTPSPEAPPSDQLVFRWSEQISGPGAFGQALNNELTCLINPDYNGSRLSNSGHAVVTAM